MQRTPRPASARPKRKTPQSKKLANAVIFGLSALLVAGLGAAVLQDQNAQARGAEAAEGYTPAVTHTNGPAPDRVVIIGDSYVAGSREGGNGDANWTQKIRPLIRHEEPLDYYVHGLGGSGYVSGGSANMTFGEAAQRWVGSTTDVVVVFGSLNDREHAGDVREAAAATYESIERAAPKAQIVVVGPPAPYAEPTDVDNAIADEVRTAAEGHADVYVDPIADDWFDDESIIGDDGVHPTDEGHEVMAELIVPALQEAVSKVE